MRSQLVFSIIKQQQQKKIYLFPRSPALSLSFYSNIKKSLASFGLMWSPAWWYPKLEESLPYASDPSLLSQRIFWRAGFLQPLVQLPVQFRVTFTLISEPGWGSLFCLTPLFPFEVLGVAFDLQWHTHGDWRYKWESHRFKHFFHKSNLKNTALQNVQGQWEVYTSVNLRIWTFHGVESWYNAWTYFFSLHLAAELL